MGSRSQPLIGLVGERVGVVEIGVAGTYQLKGRQTGALQLGEPVEVAVAHAAAADDGEGQFFGHVHPFYIAIVQYKVLGQCSPLEVVAVKGGRYIPYSILHLKP